MMFGYASNETADYMPLTLDLAHKILQELAVLRRENKQIQYLRPDAKSQVTIEYDDNNKPIRIDTIVVSTQHDDFASEKQIDPLRAGAPSKGDSKAQHPMKNGSKAITGTVLATGGSPNQKKTGGTGYFKQDNSLNFPSFSFTN